MKHKISITIDASMLKQIDNLVDNLYIRNRSQAIEHLMATALGDNREAVILAGGSEEALAIGNEFRTTIPVKGKPLILHMIRKLRSSGFKKIHLIARKQLLTKLFGILGTGDEEGIVIRYHEEKSSQGSADSLRHLKGVIDQTFLVVYGDLYFDKVNLEQLWQSQVKERAIATLMLTTSNKPSERGNVMLEGNTILQFIQKPKQSDNYLVFSPIFVADPDLLQQAGSSLEKEVFPELAKRGLLHGHVSSVQEIHIHTQKDAENLR
ncbi:NTP transferase domain-containing protein [Candidatus Woesearchaeota archaeon]|nr:NTP transferase domain-containing protein [Candidatus Woesearchaeota archaeon]